MASYRTDLLDRLVAMEHEALDAYVASAFPGATGIDAIPFLFHEQATTPYIVHRIGRSTPGPETEDASNRTYEVGIRVVIGHLTANYHGQNEKELNEILPLLEQYFIEHLDLTTNPSGTYPEPPTYLWPEDMSMADTTGVQAFELGGVKSKHVGEELLLTIPIWRTNSNS